MQSAVDVRLGRSLVVAVVKQAFRVMVVVGAGSPAVEAWGWVPGGAAVAEFCCGPAFSDELVVGDARQGESVDVGVSALGPVVDVVDLAAIGRDVTAGVGAPAFAGVEDQALVGVGDAAAAAQIQRPVRVL